MKRIILAFTAMLLLVGCGYTDEEKKLMKDYEKQGKTNAIEYVQNKYGITPEVTGINVLKVNTGPVPDFTPPPTGIVNALMKYDDIEFTVNITGEEKSLKGRDDYQKGEIENDIKLILERELHIDIESVDADYNGDCLLEDKYTNLESFFASMDGHSRVDIIAKTFDKVSEETVYNIDSENTELLIISCINQSAYNIISRWKYLNEHDYKLNFYNAEALDNKLSEYSLFMNGYVYKNSKGEVYCREYEIQKVNDELYVVYDTHESAGSAKVAETKDMAPARDWSRESGKVDTYPTFENPEKVSKSYAVDFGDLSHIQIFVRENNRKENDKAQRYVSLQYIDESGKEVYTHMAPTSVEGLYSLKLDREDNLKFAVMINKK